MNRCDMGNVLARSAMEWHRACVVRIRVRIRRGRKCPLARKHNGIIGNVGQRSGIAGIGQFVEVDDGILGVSDNMTDNGRADKARTAGNKDFSHKFQRIAKKYKTDYSRQNVCFSDKEAV